MTKKTKEELTKLQDHKIDEEELSKVSGGAETSAKRLATDAKNYTGGLTKKKKVIK